MLCQFICGVDDLKILTLRLNVNKNLAVTAARRMSVRGTLYFVLDFVACAVYIPLCAFSLSALARLFFRRKGRSFHSHHAEISHQRSLIPIAARPHV